MTYSEKILSRSIDPTVHEMLARAEELGLETAWDRYEAMLPQCGFGELGVCCRNCNMGPCRISPFEEEGPKAGVCGATADIIVARNLIRMIAAGAAAHSDHGRDIAHTLLLTAEGKGGGYEIKDEAKLKALAAEYDIETEGRTKEEIALDLARAVYAEFGKQEGPIQFTRRAPEKRVALWQSLGVDPRGIDREIVEIMHRTHIGVDQDYKSLLRQGVRAAIGDGWGGSMIATELQDILFGTPTPVLGKVNLGVLKKDEVNIIIHGHEPLLSEMIVAAAQEPEMVALAKSKGASGINLSGMCCTANEILMRHGVPIAGNFLQQELAITTGAVDAMVVDIQCIMQSVQTVAECYHTKVITTTAKAHIPGAMHIEFDEHNAMASARMIVKTAIDNFPNRGSNVEIPQEECYQIAGFSHETINYLLGGVYRASYRPLNDNIIGGRIRGVAGVVGCNNARVEHNYGHVEMVKELIKNDVVVVTTGCNAIACAEAGLLVPEAAAKYAGAGLAEVCETVGIPPVLHMGSCVDNSRILIACTAMVKDGGLGDDISELPVAGAAPEWMSEKAVSIGCYVVASGISTVLGVQPPIFGSPNVVNLLVKGLEDAIGATFMVEPDPEKAAVLIRRHIESKRKGLGLPFVEPESIAMPGPGST